MKRILQISLFLFNILPAHAGAANEDYEDVKTIRKSFKVSGKTELQIENKYGDIIIDTWETDSVKFDVTIKVISDSYESDHDFSDLIDVDYYQSDGEISATTEWNQYNSKIKSSAIDIATIFGREQKIVIDYHVYTPAGIDLDINNKFGDVVIADYEGDIKLEVSYGDIKLRKTEKIDELTLKYGKLRIREFDKADITLKSADADLGKGKKLTIHSTTSKIEIDNIRDFKAFSRNDKVEVESAEMIDIIAGWSDFEFQEVKGQLNNEIKFGELIIEKIHNSFQKINITGSFADVELNFESKTAFNYDITLYNGKRFSIPSTGNTTTKNSSYDNNNEYEGTFATMAIGGLPATVIIKMKSSYVDIRLDD